MTEFQTIKVTKYRLRCRAGWEADEFGCAGTGPSGFNEPEARQAAILDGWEAIDGVVACPSHVNARHLEQQAQHTEGE